MKTALITTTINVPKVLALYRKFNSSVKFYVAADEKTPLEAYQFCADIPGCEIYSPERQKELGYESSPLIGWSTDSRRNFALLEALKDGADLLVSIDDDMLFHGSESPAFGWFRVFCNNWSGLALGFGGSWFDAGELTIPQSRQRGLPADPFIVPGRPEHVVEVEIGVAQGVILGIPDTDAMTAIAKGPIIHSATDILRNGFVVHPEAYAVFNSQLTAFRRELAPAFAQFYAHQGRNTDIFASMLMRRIMAERNLYTYFGPPFGFHARQPRPLFKDLKAEMYGLEHIQAWAEYLANASINGKNVIDDCEHLMLNCPIFSAELKEVASAWYSDCGKVL